MSLWSPALTPRLRFLFVLEGWIASSFKLGITQCLVGRGTSLLMEGPGPRVSCAPTHLCVSSWGTGELWEPQLPRLGVHLDGMCGSLAAGAFSTLYIPSKRDDNMVHVGQGKGNERQSVSPPPPLPPSVLYFAMVFIYLFNFIFFKRFIYLLYVSTLQLSSDAPEEGVRSHYRWL